MIKEEDEGNMKNQRREEEAENKRMRRRKYRDEKNTHETFHLKTSFYIFQLHFSYIPF